MEGIAFVSRAAEGDEAAFLELVTKYRRFVQAICLSRIGDVAQAEDLTQEVFVSIHRDLRALRDPERFSAWVRQVTVNACRMWLRRNRARWVPLESADEREDPRAADQVRRSELRHIIEQVFARVSPKSREVLALHYLAGCSEAETAAVLGVTQTTVKSRLHEGRKQAKRALEPAIEELLRLDAGSQDAVEQIMERCGSPGCSCPETLTEGR